MNDPSMKQGYLIRGREGTFVNYVKVIEVMMDWMPIDGVPGQKGELGL